MQATNGSIIKSTNRRSRLLSMAFYLEAMLGVMWAAIHFTMEWLDRATMEISVEVSPTPPLPMHNHFHYFLVQFHTVSFKLQTHICVGSISKFTIECYRYHVSFFKKSILKLSWCTIRSLQIPLYAAKGLISKLAQHSFSNLAGQGVLLAPTEYCEGSIHNREKGEGRADSRKWKFKESLDFTLITAMFILSTAIYSGDGNTKTLCSESGY